MPLSCRSHAALNTLSIRSLYDPCLHGRELTNKIVYTANDVSVGDLDGDGEFEIVVKRLQSVKDESGNIISDGSGASYSQKDCLWAVIWDDYKQDGTETTINTKGQKGAWAEAEKVQNKDIPTGIRSLTPIPSPRGEGSINTLSGVRILNPHRGLYIKDGKKLYIK